MANSSDFRRDGPLELLALAGSMSQSFQENQRHMTAKTYQPMPQRMCALLRQLLRIKHAQLSLLAARITHEGTLMIEDFPQFKPPMPFELMLALIDGDDQFSPESFSKAFRIYRQFLRYMCVEKYWQAYYALLHPFSALAVYLRGAESGKQQSQDDAPEPVAVAAFVATIATLIAVSMTRL